MNKKPILFAVLAASLFGLGTPFAKLLIGDIHPVTLAGLFYLGSFAGLTLYGLVTATVTKVLDRDRGQPYASLAARDIPWLAGAVFFGGVLAPICLMSGLIHASGFTASLLLNLEAVATALIAIVVFKENAGKHVWLALAAMTLAGVCLTWDSAIGRFNLTGPILILLAVTGWGIDNNLTRHISDKNPVQIAGIKGLIAGGISLVISLFMGARIPWGMHLLGALLVGALSYGLSLVFFIKALQKLGASRTGLFFSFGPFIGALSSLVLLREGLGWMMLPGALLMIIGVRLVTSEKHLHLHRHSALCHAHPHRHDDMHHTHEHPEDYNGVHAHEHTHNELAHNHLHWPDTHHRHAH